MTHDMDITALVVALNDALAKKHAEYVEAWNAIQAIYDKPEQPDYAEQIDKLFTKLDDIYDDMHPGLDFITFTSSSACKTIKNHLEMTMAVLKTH